MSSNISSSSSLFNNQYGKARLEISIKFAFGNADLYSEWISKMMTWELFSEKSPSFVETAFWIIEDKVWDFPEPVDPTIAICLLKNLFPFTGTLTVGLDDNDEKV